MNVSDYVDGTTLHLAEHLTQVDADQPQGRGQNAQGERKHAHERGEAQQHVAEQKPAQDQIGEKEEAG